MYLILNRYVILVELWSVHSFSKLELTTAKEVEFYKLYKFIT